MDNSVDCGKSKYRVTFRNNITNVEYLAQHFGLLRKVWYSYKAFPLKLTGLAARTLIGKKKHHKAHRRSERNTDLNLIQTMRQDLKINVSTV